MSDELSLSITGVEPQIEIAGARRLLLATTRGKIRLILHGVEKAERAVICLGGATGRLDGPAMLYARLGLEARTLGLSVMRLGYRVPNDMTECVLDTMAGLSFLKGIGHQRVALIGHSFGGGVAIATATLNPMAVAIIAISSQLDGAHNVAQLAPRPLLLIHGTADVILPDASSRMIFERAGEPKTLKLFPGADHGLTQVGDEVHQLVRQWLTERI
ncbi:MAG TPA: dienelactone hydrolase family protein [Candidatus Binataceae bacterium]|nr:dienelactone hydrolase family protein [Candidatus Binataceae bacterium]